VEFGKESYSGKGASTDIIDASARAYLNALNKALHELQRSKKNPREERNYPGSLL